MTNNCLRRKIIKETLSWLGTPYVHQGSSKFFGTDCLGLIRGVWRACIGEEPEKISPYSADIGEFDNFEMIINAAKRYFQPVPVKNLTPGDVLIFRWRVSGPAKHLGIMVNNHSFIHAYERAGVIESTLKGLWFSKLTAVFCFPGADK